MERVFDESLGYVECNVCGSGHNRVSVSGNHLGEFEYTRQSACYGERKVTGLDEAGVLAEFDKDKFLISTRRARKAVNQFRMRMRKGQVTKMLAATATEAVPLTIVAEPSTDNWARFIARPVSNIYATAPRPNPTVGQWGVSFAESDTEPDDWEPSEDRCDPGSDCPVCYPYPSATATRAPDEDFPF